MPSGTSTGRIRQPICSLQLRPRDRASSGVPSSPAHRGTWSSTSEPSVSPEDASPESRPPRATSATSPARLPRNPRVHPTTAHFSRVVAGIIVGMPPPQFPTGQKSAPYLDLDNRFSSSSTRSPECQQSVQVLRSA